ncbi:Polyamine transporter 4 [Paramyrothecium foliicola]|nr:Polyamine transporter 4 [Paramyrothecium foliicola]
MEHAIKNRLDGVTETDPESASMSDIAPAQPAANDSAVAEEKPQYDVETNWKDNPENPLNWPAWKKALQIVMLSSTALLATIGTSIVSPARNQLMDEFNVGSTGAILPLTLYVIALGLGPVVGGPLSETLGRQPVYQWGTLIGGLFTLGAALTHSIHAFCFLRFMAGFCWGPPLAVASGTIVETFLPVSRGPVSSVFILMPFLGSGAGPIIGAFAVSQRGWRWTQWALLIMTAVTLGLTLVTGETFNPILKRRLAKKNGQSVPPMPPLASRARHFASIAVVRPIRMLLFEPIVTFICLFVSVEFGVLFSFFAAVPYTFGRVYHFSIEQSGLVFVSVVVGCLLSLVTILACEVLLYRKQVPRYPPNCVPPEHRLYPAIISSFGFPLGLFWFGWTARADISWASPAVAIVPFSWANLCVFVSTMQYLSDTYHGSVVASSSSANSFSRYCFAGIFPLFIVQMYNRLTIAWASSFFGFLSIALCPIPWVLFKYGPRLRAKSQYETVTYE